MDSRFDNIRSYTPEEIPGALYRIMADPALIGVAQFVWPHVHFESLKKKIRSCKTTEDIQEIIMLPAIKKIIDATISSFFAEGCELLDDSKGYLFISNHRDIVLDTVLLQYALFINGYATTDICLGDNLLRSPLFTEICLVNKMIKVIRKSDVTPREFLENSKTLADYIRLRIREGHSVWIAQGDGRTKDGNDVTEPGLVKMIGLGGDGDFATNYKELSIVPVAISYEYEPCDALKAIELTRKLSGEQYVKAKDEDLNSIITGIMSPKGKVHITICEPIKDEEIEDIAKLPLPERCKTLAAVMDQRIYSKYYLHYTNYIAFDILHGAQMFKKYYTRAQKKNFEAHIAKCQNIFEESGVDIATATDFLLKIYANPVKIQ